MSYDCSTQQFWEQDPLFTNTGATIRQLIERVIQPYCSDVLDKHPREIAYFAFKRAHETLGHISVQHYHLDEERSSGARIASCFIMENQCVQGFDYKIKEHPNYYTDQDKALHSACLLQAWIMDWALNKQGQIGFVQDHEWLVGCACGVLDITHLIRERRPFSMGSMDAWTDEQIVNYCMSRRVFKELAPNLRMFLSDAPGSPLPYLKHFVQEQIDKYPQLGPQVYPQHLVSAPDPLLLPALMIQKAIIRAAYPTPTDQHIYCFEQTF